MENNNQISKETKQVIERLKKEINTYLDFVLSKETDKEVAELIEYLDKQKIFYKKAKIIKNNIVNIYVKKL